jgi:hypothetical protein
VPIPTHLLDKAHTPSLYKVAASVHVSLGAAVEPQAAASADAKSLVGGGRGPAGMLRGLRAVRDKDRESLGAFRFFGNTVSSARVDLRRAKGEEAGCTRSGGDGAGAGDAGCGGAIGGVARVGNVRRGRETTHCRVDFESACELCMHSRQPLKNLNIIAELVVTVTNAQNDVDLSHESICWTIVPLTYACRVLTYASSSSPVIPHAPRETGSVFTRSCGLARASNRVLPRHLTRLCVCRSSPSLLATIQRQAAPKVAFFPVFAGSPRLLLLLGTDTKTLSKKAQIPGGLLRACVSHRARSPTCLAL